jgi:two-component system, OmpR family, phosphate regulon sensor histidine kinase PhoR
LRSGFGTSLFLRALGLVGLLLLAAYLISPASRGSLPLAGLFGVLVALATAMLAALGREGEAGPAVAAMVRAEKAHAWAQAELTEERNRLRGIVEGMEEGVLLLDSGGHVALVNAALREMLLLGADAVGKTQLEAIRHADLKEIVDQARDEGEAVTGEIEVEGLKPRRLLVRAARLPGDIGQVFAVFIDVTEVRKLESLRRDFVANVSHELRTPVTAIRSAAETLQGGIPGDPRVLDQFIGIMARNAERLHGLVEDLLDLSRIESQKLKLVPEPLDVRAVFAQVLSLFKERADKKQVELVNAAPASLPRLFADRRALEHVLTNLVDNAVKYVGERSKVVLRAEVSGEELLLKVEDTGPGIEERHLPRLFERFYRVDAGRSRELGGTGLGLSIVKHLSEAMGGAVAVDSKPGVGTTFIVSLKKAEPGSARAVA